jgi:hypothetical protein
MSKNVAVLNEHNQVLNIIIVNDDYELNTNEIFYTDTNPAYIAGDYLNGYFYPPQPYPSWIRSGSFWNAPTPMPTEGRWTWDESSLSWVESTIL